MEEALTVPAPTDDDLTRVPGIDPRIAAQLRAAEIHSVDQLARATVDQVVAACGSDVATSARAQEWIA
jgi:predicted flap endonuclease-1-like 5' DNA nuclease